MRTLSELQKRGMANRMKATVLSVFIIISLVLTFGIPAFAETGYIGDAATEIMDADGMTAGAFEEETENETEDSEELSLLAAVAETDVCSVGEVGYESVGAAIDANTGGTIKMLKDVAYDVNCAIDIPSGKSFTLDLNGKTISSTAPNASVSYIIQNRGSLVIKDSAGGGRIAMNAAQPSPSAGYASNAVNNRGTMTISSGTITCATAGASYAIDCYEGSTLTINGGVISNPRTDTVRLYCNSATLPCNATVNGGTITSARFPVYVQCPSAGTNSLGNLTINGGTFNTSDTSYNLAVYSWGAGASSCLNTKITINGGTFNGDIAISSKMPNANLSITGGTFNGEYGAYPYSDDEAGFISGGRFNGAKASDCAGYYVKPGYIDVYEKDGVKYAYPEMDPDECIGLPFNVYKLTEVTVTPDAKLMYTDEAEPELTYTIDKAAAEDFITVELERAAGTAVGSYPITAKTLKGSLDTTNPAAPVYYLPVLSATAVALEIKDGGYILHTEDNTLPEGSVVAESYARSDVELVVENTPSVVEQSIINRLPDTEEMLFTQEVHFERDGDHVTVGDVCRDSKVDITFNVGERYNGLSVAVYHVVDATRTDKTIKTVANGKVTLTAYSLSPFGIALVTDDLTVTNAIGGNDANANDEFSYKLKLSYADTFDYDILSKNGAVLSSGTITDGGEFKLKGGQKAVIKNLPVGVEYELTETAPSGYTVTDKNAKGTLAAGGATAAFTNTKGTTSGGSGDPKTGSYVTAVAVQVCVALLSLSLLVILYLLFFDRSKALAKHFGRAAR